jgi:hypothetical protein
VDDRVERPEDWDYGLTWFHGSQVELTKLRKGSSLSQNRQVAKAFSHRPVLVSISNDGNVKHNGTTPGYLYTIVGKIAAEDVRPHPHPANAAHWEWLTNRELDVELVAQTIVSDSERLSDDEIAELRNKQKRAGAKSLGE